MKEFIIFVELRQFFPYMACVYAWIVPLWANQLLPQLLLEQFDNLRIQCRHIEHMHEGVYNFFCTDSTEILFSKLRSACLICCLYIIDSLNICMKELGSGKNNF